MRWATWLAAALLAAAAACGGAWCWPEPVLNGARHLLALTGSPISRAPRAGDQVIVVLGGDPLRTETGAQAARMTGLPVYLAGGELAPSLHRLGVRERWSESISFNTETNAAVAACLLQRTGIERVTLVTDTWHMARATLWFRHFGFHVTQVASPAPAAATTGNAARQRQLHELGGLVEFALLQLSPTRPPCAAPGKGPRVAALAPPV